MPHSCSNRLPLWWLQRRQAATQLSHVSFPPREVGTTWSRVSSLSDRRFAQYRQVLRSRPNSAWLVRGGTLSEGDCTWPLQATMPCRSMALGASVETGVTAANAQHRVAQRPDHDFPGVQAYGFLPADPVHRPAGNVQPQYARYAFVTIYRGDHGDRLPIGALSLTERCLSRGDSGQRARTWSIRPPCSAGLKDRARV